MTAQPVFVLGRSSAVMEAVRTVLEPRFMIIRPFYTVSSAAEKMREALDTEGPFAVVIGAGYSSKEREDIRASARSSSTTPYWLMADPTATSRYNPANESERPNHGAEIGARALERLQSLLQERPSQEDWKMY